MRNFGGEDVFTFTLSFLLDPLRLLGIGAVNSVIRDTVSFHLTTWFH